MKPNVFGVVVVLGALLLGGLVWSRWSASDRMHARAAQSGLASVELNVEKIT